MKLRLKARPRQNREEGRRSSPMLKTWALQYAMLCTAHEVCLAMSQSRGRRVIQEWITGHRSKLSLVTSGLRDFLDYGGGKRVRRKGL